MIMIGKNLLSTVYTICLFNSIAAEFENNVCPSLWDYPTMKDNSNCWYDFAAESKVPDVIKKTGYPFQEYRVQTIDGYILTLFRIPSLNTRKEAIFMLHGIQSTSAIFVGLGKHSLAFLLSDAGYDVWLGNYRGTEYSEEHIKYNVTDRKFWDYGADDIGLIDVPTMLNTVKVYSRRKNIIYVGHSLGTTAALMYATEYPEAARKMVKLFVFLSPAHKLNNIQSPYRMFFPLLRPFLSLTNNLNVVQILSRGHSRRLTKPTCLASTALMLICLHALNLYLGPLTQIAPETLPVFFNQLPGGTSLKTLAYVTEAAKGRFRKYDYGRGRNMIKYGTADPPEYNISTIRVPIVIYYAKNDWATPGKMNFNICTQDESSAVSSGTNGVTVQGNVEKSSNSFPVTLGHQDGKFEPSEGRKIEFYEYSAQFNTQRNMSENDSSINLERAKPPCLLMTADHLVLEPMISLLIFPSLQDALNLYNSLPKDIRYGLYEVPAENFNHFDFLFGREAKSLVYDHLLKLLGKVSQTEDLMPNPQKNAEFTTKTRKYK